MALAPGRALPRRLVGSRAVSRAALFLVLMLTTLQLPAAGPATAPTLKIGVSLSMTGPDAPWAISISQGIQLAVEDMNQRGGAGGRLLETLSRDSASLGQDRVSRNNAVVADYERFIGDPSVVAAVGPQTSDDGRVIAKVLDRATFATITPSSTTFDITSPSLRALFRPGGRTLYFRTIGTDIAQGDAMARFAHARLGVRRVVIIHDGLEFGDRVIDAFARRASALGVTVVAHQLIGWMDQDYGPILQEIASLRPDAIYVGVRFTVAVKLARQAPAILPGVHLLGPESLYNRALPIQARAAGAEGWYVTNVGPDPAQSPATQAWAGRYRARFGSEPSPYSLTAYAAVIVIADALDRVVKGGRPITRATVRDAIQATRMPDAVPGPISFDADGDLDPAALSVYQVRGGAFHHVETLFVPGFKDTARE